MTDRPINLRDFEVRALLDGRKTQKRVALKSVPPMPDPNCHPNNKPRHDRPYLDSYCGERPTPSNPRGMTDRWLWWQVDDRACLPEFRVPFVPGDRLWVRETWAVGNIYDSVRPRDINPGGKPGWCGIRYAATQERCGIKDRPSIHMPRWASRITLLVEAVRVERLHDISEADAVAEGIYPAPGGMWSGVEGQAGTTARAAFALLWTGIYGPDSWTANPWVSAITFRPVLANIDQIEVVA